MFVSVYGERTNTKATDNQLHEYYGFSIALTMRVTMSLDQLGTALLSRNVALVPLAQRQGFNAKLEQLRTLLHMNWGITVMTGRTPHSANDNLVAWSTGTVYGFCEPARYQGTSTTPRLVGGEWFSSEPEAEEVGIMGEMKFDGARRFQPQTAAVGSFV